MLQSLCCLYRSRDANSGEYCPAVRCSNTVTVVKMLFSGFKCALAVCLCLVYSGYYTCVWLWGPAAFWACRPWAVICHQKLPVFYRHDCGWMKSKRQSEAGLLSTAAPPAWSPWCEGPSGGPGTSHVAGPPGSESEAASGLGRPGRTGGRPRSALGCENPRRQKAWIQTWQDTGGLGGEGRGAEKEKKGVRNTDKKRRGQEKTV